MSYYQQQPPANPTGTNGMGFYETPQNASAFGLPSGSMQTSYTYSGNGNGVYNDPSQLSKGVLAAFSTSGYPGEPPLMEELGVNFGHIKSKTIGVLGFKSRSLSDDVIHDSDLAGPLFFCLLFGTLLLLSGKTHFGYIYGVALFGTVSLHVLFKLMSNDSVSNVGSPVQGTPSISSQLDIVRTASVLGYCLLPLVLLSGVAVIVDLDCAFGYVMGIVAILWCTVSASGFFVRVLNLSNARGLVGYPLAMFYTVFALMAIFVEKKE